jgi:hypothetical protein
VESGKAVRNSAAPLYPAGRAFCHTRLNGKPGLHPAGETPPMAHFVLQQLFPNYAIKSGAAHPSART